jgi:hypothetical protein
MSKDQINKFQEAIDEQPESLLERVIEKAEKRNMRLEDYIKESFIASINQ